MAATPAAARGSVLFLVPPSHPPGVVLAILVFTRLGRFVYPEAQMLSLTRSTPAPMAASLCELPASSSGCCRPPRQPHGPMGSLGQTVRFQTGNLGGGTATPEYWRKGTEEGQRHALVRSTPRPGSYTESLPLRAVRVAVLGLHGLVDGTAAVVAGGLVEPPTPPPCCFDASWVHA